MKKFLALLLAMMMVLSVLSGCATDEPDEPGTDEPVTPGGNTPDASGGQASAGDSNPLYAPVIEASSYKKHINIGTGNAFAMLDPQGTYNVAHNTNNALIYNTLVAWNSNAKEFEPELATEWKWKDDVTLYLKLREGVKFHNGDEMKASDVVYSLQRCIDMGSTGGANIKQAKEFKAVSDYEVEILLNEPNVDYLSFLSLGYSSIVSEKACTADPDNGPKIGTGAWVYVSMVENDNIQMKRNDNYWGELPKSETMTIRVIPEASTRLIALQNGEIDVNVGINTTEMDIVESDKSLKLYAVDRTTMCYFAFNTQLGAGADENFRLAVAYAIDPEELLIVGAGGYGKLSGSNWGWTTYGYDETIAVRQRDLNKAKEYLAKSSYKEVTITCTSSYKTVVETIQAQLKDVGITVHVNEVQSAAQTAMSKFASATHEAMVYGLSWNEHGDDCRRPYYKDSNTNKAIVKDQEIYDWIDAAKSEFDDAKRKELYSNIQKKNYDKAYYLPLYFSQGFVVLNENVGGVRMEPNNVHDFTYACVAEK